MSSQLIHIFPQHVCVLACVGKKLTTKECILLAYLLFSTMEKTFLPLNAHTCIQYKQIGVKIHDTITHNSIIKVIHVRRVKQKTKQLTQLARKNQAITQ